MMWLLVAREPQADARGWPGRRWLAAIDAVVWPLLWVMVMNHVPQPVGLVGPLVTALALLSAKRRLHTALMMSHRYRFTTWRWGKVGAAMLLIGLVLKLTLPA